MYDIESDLHIPSLPVKTGQNIFMGFKLKRVSEETKEAGDQGLVWQSEKVGKNHESYCRGK